MSFVLTVICLNLVSFLTTNRAFYRVKGSNFLLLIFRIYIFLLRFSIPYFLTVGCPIFCIFQFCHLMPSFTQLLNRLDVTFRIVTE